MLEFTLMNQLLKGLVTYEAGLLHRGLQLFFEIRGVRGVTSRAFPFRHRLMRHLAVLNLFGHVGVEFTVAAEA